MSFCNLAIQVDLCEPFLSQVHSACIPSPSASTVYTWRRKSFPVLPAGCTVDVNCGNAACINPAHVITRPKRGIVSHLRPYAEKVSLLSVGECIEFHDYPTDRHSLIDLRTYLQARCTYLIINLRQLQDGGIRITRTGTWGCCEGDYRTTTIRPPLLKRFHRKGWAAAARGLRAAAFYLGFVSGESLHSKDVHTNKCIVKGCPFPSSDHALCRSHNKFFEYDISMTDRGLDIADIHSTDAPLETALSVAAFWEMMRDLDSSLVFRRNGFTDTHWKVTREWLGDVINGRTVADGLTHGVAGTHHGKRGPSKRIKRSQRQRHKQAVQHKVGGHHPEQKPVKKYARAKKDERLPILSKGGKAEKTQSRSTPIPQEWIDEMERQVAIDELVLEQRADMESWFNGNSEFADNCGR